MEALARWAKSALGKCLALGECSLKKTSLPSEAQYLREETGASLEISFRSLGKEKCLPGCFSSNCSTSFTETVKCPTSARNMDQSGGAEGGERGSWEK